MQWPRVIPERAYQVVAVLTLVGVVVVTVQWTLEDAGLFAWIRGATGLSTPWSAFLTFFATFLVWAACMLPLRLLSTAPTLAEELEEQGVDSMGDLIGREVARGRRIGAKGSDERSREDHLLLASGGLVAGVGGLGLTALLRWLTGSIYFAPLVVGVLGLVLAPWHFWKSRR